MTRWERRAFNGLAGIVSTSGVLYLWMQYGMRSEDPFAVVNHPLQPLMLHVHVMAAPWLILAFGMIVNSHVAGRIVRPSPNRWTGLGSLATFLVMTFSGYALQVVTAPVWSRGMLALHLASSGFFLVAYVVHLVIGLRAARTARAEAPEAGRRTTA